MTFINVYGSNVVFSGDPATAAGLATVRLVKKTPGLGLFEVQIAPMEGPEPILDTPNLYQFCRFVNGFWIHYTAGTSLKVKRVNFGLSGAQSSPVLFL